MKWWIIVAGVGVGIAVYAASRRIPSSSSSSNGERRPRNRDRELDDNVAGIAVGEWNPSTPGKGTVLSDGGGIMAGYPGYELWSGGCGGNCGGEHS